MSDTQNLVQGKTNWSSIYIAAALSFVGAVQFSLYFSALWPYMRILDNDITESFYGWTVFVYSFGQVLSAPAFGWWSNMIKMVRPPLYCGLILMFTGNFIYILMEVISGVPKRFVLMVCRFIIGMGSGNVATLRSYASTASSLEDRSKAIAFVTCGQAIGMTMGPAFQFIFTQLEYPGPAPWGLSLNLYTTPAYLACLMNVGGAYALYHYFEEVYAIELIEDDEVEEDETETMQQAPAIPMYDIIAVLVCYASRFTDMFVRTNLETLGSPYSMMMFSLDEVRSVRYLSMTQGIIGALTFATYIAYINFDMEKIVPNRPSCLIALTLMLSFHLVTYPWQFLSNYVDPLNGTTGCDTSRFTWCDELTQVNIYLYYGSYVILIGTAFPLLTITLTTLFSKILGPRRQGTQQGLFQAASAIGRMIAPVSASALYTGYGPRAVWKMEIAVVGVVLGAWCLFYGRMVEMKIPKKATNQCFGYENPQAIEDESTMSHG
ncbi:unnamed protein product [Bursaphelenchus okinawaensis]|uniref:Major facilitator superfamily (MFS) profile domain-containing protein n=1 Tax=Bursaphelenchus okinawaensis TaxID=465554 RepID=A0A811KXW5_9BILA|nr:unnamed protein product [Bursaphelenchus okinawaensis]CAG9113624.1 unnamed protein product [Bursaphelenchus okinawaensis]